VPHGHKCFALAHRIGAQTRKIGCPLHRHLKTDLLARFLEALIYVNAMIVNWDLILSNSLGAQGGSQDRNLNWLGQGRPTARLEVSTAPPASDICTDNQSH
jgi:hypothetical protein